jgi:hypothetical protein
MTRLRLLLAALLLPLGAVLAGCDTAGDSGSAPAPETAVYVSNQGNFGDGNGSVTRYDPTDETTRTAALDGLNSIVQSLALRDTSLLVMANTGPRIDAFSTEGLSPIAQFTAVNSPRYAAFTGPSTAYVTDQSPFGSSLAPAVRILDLDASSVVGSIRVSGTPEGITVADNRAYAALGAFGDTTLVAAIDLSDNVLDREIDIDCAAREVVADGDGDVFALCGNAAEAVVLDAASGSVETRLALPDTAETTFGVGHAAYYAAEAEELYVPTDSGILRVDTGANAVDAMIDVGLSGPPGAVGYDAERQTLYVARVAGFTASGTVTLHARDGAQTGSFTAGIAPTDIVIQQDAP